MRSTPNKLLGTLKLWASKRKGIGCYIGAVQYRNGQEVSQLAVNLLAKHGPKNLGVRSLRANLLLQKRIEYRHEQEVRLIAINDSGSDLGDRLSISFEPNEVFEEITFDPRLKTFEQRERQDRLSKEGYSGKFSESPQYIKAIIEAILD